MFDGTMNIATARKSELLTALRAIPRTFPFCPLFVSSLPFCGRFLSGDSNGPHCHGKRAAPPKAPPYRFPRKLHRSQAWANYPKILGSVWIDAYSLVRKKETFMGQVPGNLSEREDSLVHGCFILLHSRARSNEASARVMRMRSFAGNHGRTLVAEHSRVCLQERRENDSVLCFRATAIFFGNRRINAR